MICLRSRDHLAGTSILRVVRVRGEWRILHDELTVVSSVPMRPAHHLPEVRDQRSNQECRVLEDVLQGAPGWRPAAGCKEILLPVDRQVVRIFATITSAATLVS